MITVNEELLAGFLTERELKAKNINLVYQKDGDGEFEVVSDQDKPVYDKIYSENLELIKSCTI